VIVALEPYDVIVGFRHFYSDGFVCTTIYFMVV